MSALQFDVPAQRPYVSTSAPLASCPRSIEKYAAVGAPATGTMLPSGLRCRSLWLGNAPSIQTSVPSSAVMRCVCANGTRTVSAAPAGAGAAAASATRQARLRLSIA